VGISGISAAQRQVITPSHFSVRDRPWEVHTTTDGGVLRLFALLEFSEDRCDGRLLAVNANTRDHERDIASTDIRCNTSELAGAPTA
jgi:hypothetical protein